MRIRYPFGPLMKKRTECMVLEQRKEKRVIYKSVGQKLVAVFKLHFIMIDRLQPNRARISWENGSFNHKMVESQPKMAEFQPQNGRFSTIKWQSFNHTNP